MNGKNIDVENGPGGSPAAGLLGLYIHIPFCAGGKCPYCDFYSLPFDGAKARQYIDAARRCLQGWGKKAAAYTVDTVYFGGGTPSLVTDGLITLLEEIRAQFSLSPAAEITLEANPATAGYEDFAALRAAGFNRLSLGLQSACEGELALLKRRHTAEEAGQAFWQARRAGFDNISLDLMLCLPGQTGQSLARSVDYVSALSPEHVSAYLLKIEEGTPFYAQKESLLQAIPDEDGQAEMYLSACRMLEEKGYRQYEISNFARRGKVSRHNLKYWNCDEYIGIGPSAHSFFKGARFYYPRDLASFAGGGGPVPDGAGGGLEEYLMLRLRLSEGVSGAELKKRYGGGMELFDDGKIRALQQAGLAVHEGGRLRLTPRGFAVSNSVITYLVF